ncbi:hypothetical protein GUITHDRAFT_141763 [Guillardia theta CCMP2712]|uniref:Uncharacterized protein n=1 Tax=Guillardia theta (strain CCMP2712) TaxID=905079 RepID=L1J0G0_GUITC|nr:hypothetical protein GUITHDRAFT_141763 [Guillardia theta CCMP2712]EKX41772.1 hypothetical protein GUITHDRAFT_141763 [Guillardia theta CCMP2712]|eukprot:XP_005828752.1 hypothetical protein GUITHDRAFT_141763 [Guillardia theta CCMP2712]
MNIVDDFLTWGGGTALTHQLLTDSIMMKDLLFKFRPDFPFERPTSSIPASWYISPKQTFGELVVWNLFFWTLTYVIFMVLASLLWVLYYKYLTNTVVYILQPCHLVSIMLVYLFWCRDIAHGSLIFSMFTHMNVGTLLALVVPLQEGTVCCHVSILVGNNINYMMSPPKGPLLWFGDHYRSIQTFGTYLLLLLPAPTIFVICILLVSSAHSSSGLLFPAMVDLAKRMSGKWRRQKSA